MSSNTIIDVQFKGPGRTSKSLKQWAEMYSKTMPRKVFQPALKDATSRTVRRSRTRAVRRMAKQSMLPAKVIRKRTQMTKGEFAGVRNTTVGLVVYVAGVTLGQLKTRPVRQGLRAGKHYFEGGFMGTARSGHGTRIPMGFKRVGKERTPLEILKIEIKGVEQTGIVLRRYAQSFFPRRFIKQLEYRSELLKGN